MMRRVALPVWVMCGLLMTSLPAGADVLTHSFRTGVDGYSGTDDVLIRSTSADGNFSGALTMHVGGTNRSLLRFDLGALEGDPRAVESATLMLTTGGAQVNAGQTVQIYAVHADDGDWIAGDGSGDDGATWNHKDRADATATWREMSGGGPAGAGETDLIATFQVPENSNETFEVPLPGAIVEQWIAGSNSGMLLRYEDESADVTYFRRSIDNNASRRPMLTVTFVPEPASAALTGIASAMLLCRPARRHR